jgi:4-alpha-glucanotransferase
VLRYLGRADASELHWEMIRSAWSSVAMLAIAPLQDVLGFGGEGRMNIPGQPLGNWCWRYHPEVLTPGLSARLAELTSLYGRDKLEEG